MILSCPGPTVILLSTGISCTKPPPIRKRIILVIIFIRCTCYPFNDYKVINMFIYLYMNIHIIRDIVTSPACNTQIFHTNIFEYVPHVPIPNIIQPLLFLPRQKIRCWNKCGSMSDFASRRLHKYIEISRQKTIERCLNDSNISNNSHVEVSAIDRH